MGQIEISSTKVVKKSFQFVFSNLNQFFVVGGPVFIALTGLYVFSDLVSEINLGIGIVIFEAIFAYAWHRYYLLGTIDSYWLFSGFKKNIVKNKRLERSTQRFLIWSLIFLAALYVFALIIAGFIISGTDSSLGGIIVILFIITLAISPLYFRSLLFFPDVVVNNENASINHALDISEEYNLKIWLAYMLAFTLMYLLLVGLTMAINFINIEQYFSALPSSIILNFSYVIINFLLVAVGVTLNSEIYRLLSEKVSDSAADIEVNID